MAVVGRDQRSPVIASHKLRSAFASATRGKTTILSSRMRLGGPSKASNLLRRSFAPLLARAGIARLRFHDLRHTAATLMLGQGVHPKVVSEMLGHSQISVTLDLYSHVTPTMQRDATAAVDAALGG